MDEIMGVNGQQARDQLLSVKPDMLDVQMDIFTYPEESGCCPLQPSKANNMNLTAEMKQLKLVYMQQ